MTYQVVGIVSYCQVLLVGILNTIFYIGSVLVKKKKKTVETLTVRIYIKTNYFCQKLSHIRKQKPLNLIRIVYYKKLWQDKSF